MTENKELATRTAEAGAQNVERLAATGGNGWLAVTHYSALASLAQAMCRAKIAPKDMTPEAALGIMAFGLEMGFGPIASLKSIAFVNGKASMYGDGIMALLMRSGELADMPEETIAGDGDQRTATCTLRRKGLATTITRTFSMADAKRAGLLSKSGPWAQYPDRMLRWRAFGWAARDGFADVLNGMWTREEAQDIPTDAVEVRTVERPSAFASAPFAAPPAEPLPPGDAEITSRTPVRRAAPMPEVEPGPIPLAKPAPAGGNGGIDEAPNRGGVWTPEHKRLADAILALAEGDKEIAAGICERYTEFTNPKGERVRGVRSVADMRLKRVRATWPRVQKDFDALNAEDAGVQSPAAAADAASCVEDRRPARKARPADDEEEIAAIEAGAALDDGLPF